MEGLVVIAAMASALDPPAEKGEQMLPRLRWLHSNGIT